MSLDTISVCEPCIAYDGAIEPSYWDGDPEGFARCESGWLKNQDLIIAYTYADDDPDGEGYPVRHFDSGPCAICGSFMGGDYYTCTYTTKEKP